MRIYRGVITDITIAEIRARIEKTVKEEVAKLQKFRVRRSSSLPEVVGMFSIEEKTIVESLHRSLKDFLNKNKPEIIDTSEQKAGPVFEKYFSGTPPFDSGNKKHEFPDAFVIVTFPRI